MDVRRAQLTRDAVITVVADGAGVREVALAGEAAARVLAVAAPLVARLGGEVVVDWLAGEARGRLGTVAVDEVPTALARAIVDEVRVRPALPDRARDAEFWSHLYRIGGDGWELGRAAPPLVRWVEEHRQPGRRTLVVGSGRGHEARAFAEAGDRVVGVDYSEEAIAQARAAGGDVEFRLADLFELPAAGERWELVVEHTCFCAIEPERRDDYVDAVADLLVPGGRLVGLFWQHGRPGGPPYSVTRAELEERLGRRLVIQEIGIAPDSVATRRGEELLVVARRPA